MDIAKNLESNLDDLKRMKIELVDLGKELTDETKLFSYRIESLKCLEKLSLHYSMEEMA